MVVVAREHIALGVVVSYTFALVKILLLLC